MNKAHVAWCKAHFRTIKDGGVWGIPRSGLLFQKRGNELHLVNRMPWMDGMPISAAQLQEQQECELNDVIEHFEAAGIVVKREEENVE